MSEITKQKGVARIYCCGGAGVNIGSQMEFTRGASELGMATTDICYVDTSLSNYDSKIPADATYLLKDKDGSGGIRAENHESIANCTRDIIQKFEPRDINIVISSASGGSGSVIAPSIVSELLAQDKQVIAVIIGDTDTRIHANNSLKTIQSYSGISKLRKKSVVVYYAENSADTPRKKVDNDILHLVTCILMIYSRENRELDSRDLYNFLNFDRVTTFEPQLAALNMYFNQFSGKNIGEGQHIVSVATVLMDDEQASIDFTPDYRCIGYLPGAVDKKLVDLAPVNLVVSAGMMGMMASRLNAMIADLDKAAKARVMHKGVEVNLDDATDNGLVL